MSNCHCAPLLPAAVTVPLLPPCHFPLPRLPTASSCSLASPPSVAPVLLPSLPLLSVRWSALSPRISVAAAPCASCRPLHHPLPPPPTMHADPSDHDEGIARWVARVGGDGARLSIALQLCSMQRRCAPQPTGHSTPSTPSAHRPTQRIQQLQTAQWRRARGTQQSCCTTTTYHRTLTSDTEEAQQVSNEAAGWFPSHIALHCNAFAPDQLTLQILPL